MALNKDPVFAPHAAPSSAHTSDRTNLPKRSPRLYIRYTVSDPSSLDPNTTLTCPFDVPSNTPNPVPNNTPIEPTEEFKNPAKNIIEVIPYLTSSMSNEPEMVLLQLAELRQELKVAGSIYQFAIPHPRKYLLRVVIVLIKLLTRHLQYHLSFLPTPLNHLDPDKRDTTASAAHRDFTSELLLYIASSKYPSIFPP